jgi:hypothetical protein
MTVSDEEPQQVAGPGGLKEREQILLPQVLLPHWVAVVVGAALFVAALVDAPGLESLQP